MQFVNTYNVCKAIEIAMTACILQNFCVINNDQFDEISGHNRDDNNFEDILNIDNNRAARLKRDLLANDLVNMWI